MCRCLGFGLVLGCLAVAQVEGLDLDLRPVHVLSAQHDIQVRPRPMPDSVLA